MLKLQISPAVASAREISKLYRVFVRSNCYSPCSRHARIVASTCKRFILLAFFICFDALYFLMAQLSNEL